MSHRSDTTDLAERLVEPAGIDCLIHLHAGDVSVLVDLTAGRIPSIAYWGADLGGLSAAGAAGLVRAGIPPVGENTVDTPIRLAVLPSTGPVGSATRAERLRAGRNCRRS